LPAAAFVAVGNVTQTCRRSALVPGIQECRAADDTQSGNTPETTTPIMRHALPTLLLLVVIPLATGCDQLSEALDIPNPKKAEAEGRAVGSACRHAGRSLEDCYTLNPAAQKAAVFSGWREMNDYMMEHKLEVVPSQIAPPVPAARTPGPLTETPKAAAAH
jgi:hypothetical protein